MVDTPKRNMVIQISHLMLNNHLREVLSICRQQHIEI